MNTNSHIRISVLAVLIFSVFQFSEARAQHNRWVDSVFHSMTPDERLGQLFMVEVSSTWSSADKQFQKVESYIDDCHIGGVVFFYGGPCRQASLCNRLQLRSKVPLMVAQDAEWGLSMRLDSVPVYPRNLCLGAIKDDGIIRDLGREMGRECRRLGVNIDFMPCVDLYDNFANPVIANRSFGSGRKNVARKGINIMHGMQHCGVLTTAKHFPGHGNTSVDSHEALPVITDSYSTIDTLDMYPFKALIKAGVQGVMVGHLLIPAIVGSGGKTPASISGKVIQNVLIDSLGFDGLVFTDALQMKGVCKDYPSGLVELMAFEAGVDVFLIPADCKKSFDYMVEARNSGRIQQADIDRKCRKILYAKYRMGLHSWQPIRTEDLYKDLNTKYSAKLQRRIMENAVTLIKNDSSLLPLRDLAEKRIAVVSVNASGNGGVFESTFCQYTHVDIFRIQKTAKDSEFASLAAKLDGYDVIVLGLETVNPYPPSFGTPDPLVTFVDNLAENHRLVVDVFNSPVSLTRFGRLDKFAAIVVSYDATDLSQEVSAQMILGSLPFLGQLPVSLGPAFPEGKSIVTKPLIKIKN